MLGHVVNMQWEIIIQMRRSDRQPADRPDTWRVIEMGGGVAVQAV